MKKRMSKFFQGSLAIMLTTPIIMNLQLLTSGFVFAETTVQELVDDVNAKITVDHEIDQASNLIHWTMNFTKYETVPTSLRQMQFGLEVAEGDLLVADSVQEAEGTFGIVGPIDDDWYYAGDFSSEAETIKISFDTRIVEGQESCTLTVAPRIGEHYMTEAIEADDAEQSTELLNDELKTAEEQQFLTVGQAESYQVTVRLREADIIESEPGEEPDEEAEETLKNDDVILEEDSELPVDVTNVSQAAEAAIAVAPLAANTADTQHADLKGAYANAVPLNQLFAFPSSSNTNNSAKFTDGTNKLIELTNSAHSNRSRATVMSTDTNAISFGDLQSDMTFTSYMKFDEHTEGIAFFMHNGEGNSWFFSRRGLKNHYDPSSFNYKSDALGIYKHNGLLGDITNYMQNALVLEFDNRKGGIGDTDVAGAHIAVAKSNEPDRKRVIWDSGDNYAFENDSWWQLDVSITPGKKLNFTMTDLSDPETSTHTATVDIADYVSKTDTNKIYYGFTATTATTVTGSKKTNKTSLFMTNMNYEVNGEINHLIKDASGNSVQGTSVSPGAELAHEVIMSNSKGSDLIITTGEGISILGEEDGANSLDYTTIDGSTVQFVYEEINDDKPESKTVAGTYQNGRFYPNESIRIAENTQLLLKYRSTVKTTFDDTENGLIQVLDKVGIKALVGSATSGNYFEAKVQNPVAYSILLDHEPTVDLTTVDEAGISKGDYHDLGAFYYQFAYQDLDQQPLAYEIKINNSSYTSGNLVNDDSSGTEESSAIMIDVLDAESLFEIGANTISITLSDGKTAVTDTEEFTITGFTGFEIAPTNAAWRYARKELKSELTAMPRKEEMQLKLRDTISNQSSLRLQLTVTDLTDDSSSTSIDKNRLMFDKHKAQGASHEVPTNELITYGNDEGLLLKLKDSDPNGQYQGTMTWTIVDAL